MYFTQVALRTHISVDQVNNVSAANLRDRTTHTGTQLSSTILIAEETRSVFPYTVVAADNGKVLLLDSVTPAAVAVPTSLGTGFSCTFIQIGAGRITFSSGVGATLQNASSTFITSGPYAPVTLLPLGLDLYNLVGSVGEETGTGAQVFNTDPTIVRGIIQYNATLANNAYHGQVITGLNAGTVIAQWQSVYLGPAGTWLLADANGTNTYPMRGIAVAAGTSGNPLTVLEFGIARNDAWSWTPGADVYLSGAEGGLIQPGPSAIGDNVQRVGYALTATILRLNIGTAEYSTRSA